MLTDAMRSILQMAAAHNPKIEIDNPARRLPQTYEVARRLTEIFWDMNLARVEKVDLFIKDLMEPHNIDVIVTGFVNSRRDGALDVRPIVIVRHSKRLVTNSRIFAEADFTCRDPNNPDRLVLCAAVLERMKDTAAQMLKDLQ